MPTRRQERVGERIHEEISQLLQTRVRDPRLAQVTVTGVDVSPDLKAATVFVSTLGDRESSNAALRGLQHASSFLRRALAQQLDTRFTPELRFVLDNSWQRGARIDELLEQLPSMSDDEPAEPSAGKEQPEY
jgi:ribosome-binding factor A